MDVNHENSERWDGNCFRPRAVERRRFRSPGLEKYEDRGSEKCEDRLRRPLYSGRPNCLRILKRAEAPFRLRGAGKRLPFILHPSRGFRRISGDAQRLLLGRRGILYCAVLWAWRYGTQRLAATTQPFVALCQRPGET